MTAVDNFTVALIRADIEDDDARDMFRSGYHLSEITDRVSTRSGLDVTDAMTAAWLVEVGGFDECQAVYGPAACERPATPNSSPARCVDCDRSNR